MMTGSTYHTNGKPVQTASDESLVLACEGLIGDLSARGGIAPAVAGINNHITFVSVVSVSAR